MRRFFSSDGIVHVYQRTVSGFNIFYSQKDFIVFYTIVSVYARRYGICLLGLCQMIDHVHFLMSVESVGQMGRFMSAYSSAFVREFNSHNCRRGKLFDVPYGSAVKFELKKIRSAVAYLFNNPVEKKLCMRAEAYRWNYLAYFNSRNPFSNPHQKCSRRLRRAMAVVNNSFASNRHIGYSLLDKLLEGLDRFERDSVTDYLISVYFPFDKLTLAGYYKSFEHMLVAINSNTGSEYEISEKHYSKSDLPYREIMLYLKKSGIEELSSVIVMSQEWKTECMDRLRRNTSASLLQIKKFLHIP